MNILDVVPLSRGINKETLSYFSGEPLATGAVVRVPLRNKTANALVVSSRAVQDIKQEIKDAAFTYKKIDSILTQDLFSPAFMAAAKKTADYHVATLGSMLFSLVPKIVLENAGELASVKSPVLTPVRLHANILQTDDDDRFLHYRSLIREQFARGRSVFLCVPTVADIKRAERLLEKGIAEYAYIFHGRTKKSELVKNWNRLTLEAHPVLIVATGQFLCLPRHDIGTIIIERESSRTYKGVSRPFTDIRYFAEAFARETGAKIIFGDALLRTETVWRYQNDEFHEVTPPTMRVQTRAEQRLVDMRKIHRTTVKFDPISPALADLIRAARDKSERLVIFASRRGLAPLTICADCSSIVACHRCQAPVVLHSKGDERYFLCHRCGEKRDANEKCAQCTSWRLQTLGIGSELIGETIAEQFPGYSIQRMDSDTVKTHAQANAIIKKFYETPGGILVCTEMALLYLSEKVENVAIASVDSMFSTPDFRIRERVLSILVRLRALATKNFIIQTRNVTEPVFGYAERGNLLDFYREEIRDREQFDYPPFTVLIKISLSGSERAKVEHAMRALAEQLSAYEVSVYPAFIPLARGFYTMHALIKIGRQRWVSAAGPEIALVEKLRALPQVFRIAVDPDSVL